MSEQHVRFSRQRGVYVNGRRIGQIEKLAADKWELRLQDFENRTFKRLADAKAAALDRLLVPRKK